MRIASLSRPTAALVFFAAVGAATLAQSAQQPPAGGAPADHAHGHGPMPPPTNLQVLPKTLTGDQVHEIMHKWEAELGTECGTCHAADPTHKSPSGRPMLNFADDSKPKKATARLMYTMCQTINTQFISKIENSDKPVSCATCHRGHLEPPVFVPPPENEHHDHPATPAAPGKPAPGQ